MSEAKLRVALLCPGIGLVRRGGETFISECYSGLRALNCASLDVTLFQGGEREKGGAQRLWCLHRYSPTARRIGKLRIPRGNGIDRGHWTECLTFSLSYLLKRNTFGQHDVVHVTDSQLKNFFCLYKRLGILKCTLVFSVGLSLRLLGCGLADERQHASIDVYHFSNQRDLREAIARGIVPSDKACYIPQGVDVVKFSAGDPLRGLGVRRHFGIPDTAKVVVSVGVFDRSKNMNTLLDAFGDLPTSCYLTVLGDSADRILLEEARSRLGKRFVFKRLAQRDLVDFLSTCNVFAFPSMEESFGRSIPEAACAGLPCLVHDDELFTDLIPDPHFRVNMSDARALRHRLVLALEDCGGEKLRFAPTAARIKERFGWQTLAPIYAQRLYGLRNPC